MGGGEERRRGRHFDEVLEVLLNSTVSITAQLYKLTKSLDGTL